MQQAGVAPDSSTFAALISSWGAAKQPERADAVLELMQQAVVAPDSSTFAALILAWGNAKQPERAEAVLELMQQSGVAPDSSTFTSLIRACIAAKQPERAEAVLELMQQSSVAPDSSTFVSLINSWDEAKQPDRAEAVLELMQQSGVAPDRSTFVSLINSWGAAKQPDRAEAVLELMQQFGVRADSKCLAAIARVRTQNPQSKPSKSIVSNRNASQFSESSTTPGQPSTTSKSKRKQVGQANRSVSQSVTDFDGFTFEVLDKANLEFDGSLIDEMINFQAEMRIEELDRSLGAGIGASKERHKLGLRIKAYAEFEAQL